MLRTASRPLLQLHSAPNVLCGVCYVILCYVTLFCVYVVLCYVVLCYVTLRYVMLYFLLQADVLCWDRMK